MNFKLIATSALASLALGVQLTDASYDALVSPRKILEDFGQGSSFINSTQFGDWYGQFKEAYYELHDLDKNQLLHGQELEIEYLFNYCDTDKNELLDLQELKIATDLMGQ